VTQKRYDSKMPLDTPPFQDTMKDLPMKSDSNEPSGRRDRFAPDKRNRLWAVWIQLKTQ